MSQRVADLLARFERVAAAVVVSAERAERDADGIDAFGGAGRARELRERASRARRSVEQGRHAARRVHLRRQAAEVLDSPRDWSVHLHPRSDSGLPSATAWPRVDAAVIGTDLTGIVRLWNDAAQRLYGWRADAAIGRPITELTVGPDDAEVAERIMTCVRETGNWEGEFWVRRRDGTLFLAYVRDAVVADLAGRPVGVVGVSIDDVPGLRHPSTRRCGADDPARGDELLGR